MSFEYMQGIQEQVNRNEIIALLRSALADELNAVHQYWMQAALIQGHARDSINKELYQHRDEEMGHANMLIDRIVQLEGNPDVRPLQWDRIATCNYDPVINRDQKIILDQAIEGENCAIQHYTKISQFVENKDTITFDIVMKIIEDEYEHISDLKKLQELILPKYAKES